MTVGGANNTYAVPNAGEIYIRESRAVQSAKKKFGHGRGIAHKYTILGVKSNRNLSYQVLKRKVKDDYYYYTEVRLTGETPAALRDDFEKKLGHLYCSEYTVNCNDRTTAKQMPHSTAITTSGKKHRTMKRNTNKKATNKKATKKTDLKNKRKSNKKK